MRGFLAAVARAGLPFLLDLAFATMVRACLEALQFTPEDLYSELHNLQSKIKNHKSKISSSSEQVQYFPEFMVDAGKNRRVAQRVIARFGRAQFHHQVEKIFGLVRFEPQYEFLVIEPE